MKRIAILLYFTILTILSSAQANEDIAEWINKGKSAIEGGRPRMAIFYYELAKSSIERLKLVRDYDFVYTTLFELYADQGELSKEATTLSDLANYYADNGEISLAIKYGHEALDKYLEYYGKEEINYSIVLSNLATYYSENGIYSKAIEYGTRAVNLKKELSGEYDESYATSLSNLADLYSSIGDYPKAIDLAIKASRIQSDLNRPSFITYNNIAQYYSNLGDYSKALLYGNQALELAKTSLGNNKTDYAIIISNIAGYYFLQGDYNKVIPSSKEALTIFESVYGKNHPKYANELSKQSQYYLTYGDLQKAFETATESMYIRKSVYGETHPDYAWSLLDMAGYYSVIGDLAKSIEFGEKALSIQAKIYGEKHPLYAETLNNLGTYYSLSDNLPKAIELEEKAVDILNSVLGEKHKSYLTSLSNLAQLFFEIGDTPKAINLCKKVIEGRKENLRVNHKDYAESLLNLASYLSSTGDYSKSIEFANEALKRFISVFGEKHQSVAKTLNNLGNYYSAIGDYTHALESLDKSREFIRTILGEDHSDYATSLNNLAGVYAKLGDYSKAIDLSKKALGIVRKILGENHQYYTTTLNNLVIDYYALGDYTKAFDFINYSCSLVQSKTLRYFSNFSIRNRLSFWGKNSILFTDYYPSMFYLSNSNKTSELYNKSLFAKGLLLSSEIVINRLIQESGDEEVIKIFKELQSKRLQLMKQVEIPVSQRQLNVDSLIIVTDKLERSLIEHSNVYSEYTVNVQANWKDIQNSLSSNEIAVEFLSFKIHGTDSTMMTALTLRKEDREPIFIPLFEYGQLQEIINSDHSLIPELTALVWQPLQKELQGINRIYFSPAGVLHKIGIEYAPGMENYEMFRLSSTREIMDLKKESSGKTLPDAILYGGIDYDMSGHLISPDGDKMIVTNDSVSQQIAYSMHRTFIDSLDLRGAKISFLPSTLTEVQNISSSLKQAKYPTIVHVGTDATETSVKELSGKSPSILHISTHGFYFTEKQAKKKDYLHFMGFEGQKNVNEEDKSLSRSGLLMAGANRSLEGEDISINDDDGILTAQEISLLDLRGTDLVVLSACETGRGDIMQGEGVFGLQRGFKKAGVKSILMSLWKVSDLTTEMLMTEFYKNYCEGKSKRESLRLAQKKVREYKDDEGNLVFQDPHYWAGFVMLD